MIDQVISHYRIIQKLGAGGMGEVYLAADLTLGRRVALKLLPHEQTQDEERLRRFKQEAKSASALNHPNILTIHEVGEADGHHFIATEFIDGESLRAALDRTGRMSDGQRGARGGTDGFGLVGGARGGDRPSRHQAGEHHAPARWLRQSPRFRTGQADGRHRSHATRTRPRRRSPCTPCPAWCSARRSTCRRSRRPVRDVDTRSDIFAFGAVLYEMVTGERAFPGSSQVAAVAAILTQEPRPLPATIPAELTQVIVRCLEEGSRPALPVHGGGEGRAGGSRECTRLDANPTRDRTRAVDVGRARARCSRCWLHCVASVSQPGHHRAAASGPADDRGRPRAVSLAFARRRPRCLHVDRARAGESRHLRPTDRFRRSGQTHQ